MTTITISIIGGGATGAAVLIELCNHFIKSKLQNVTIRIFEPNILGQGVAYRTRDPHLLMNTTAEIVTIMSKNVSDFLQWLKQEEQVWRQCFPNIIENYDEHSFMPRVLTQFYINSRLSSTLEEAMSAGINIQHIREYVTNIEYHNDEIDVVSINQKYNNNTACIICTGHATPNSYAHLDTHPNYIHFIYVNESRLQQIPSDKKVLILGSQLSAIDAVILLSHLKHHITLASRKGELPSVRKSMGRMQGFHLTDNFITQFSSRSGPISLQEMVNEIEVELSIACNKKDYSILHELEKPITNTEETLEQEIKACELGENCWEQSIISILKFIKKTWGKLTTEDQKLFHKQHERLIHRLISAFPLEVSYKILRMFKQKSLKIKSGVVKVETRKEKFVAHYKNKGVIETEEFDYIINATSRKIDLRHRPSVLFKNMLENNLAQIDMHDGLALNGDLSLKNDLGKKLPIYAAGPITSGERIFTNLLLGCVEQAEMISEEIIKTVLVHKDS